METLLSILGYVFLALIFGAIIAQIITVFKDEQIKNSLKKVWCIVIAIVAVAYWSCRYTIYYNKPASKICKNIEDNPNNWSYHLDSAVYKSYLKYTANIIDFSHYQFPHILENKNCGIKIIIDHSLYGGQYEMTSPFKYVFSKEEGEKIYETYSTPIKEYNQRLMEPIRLVEKWREKTRQDSSQKVLHNTLNNCKYPRQHITI